MGLKPENYEKYPVRSYELCGPAFRCSSRPDDRFVRTPPTLLEPR